MDVASRRGPYKPGIKRRQEIVRVATEVFGEFGFRSGTLKKVADRVGGTPAAILKLFGTKKQLLIAVLENWGDAASRIVRQGTVENAHLDGLVQLMRYHVEHRGLLALYTTMAASAASSTQHPAHEFMKERYRATLENMRGWFRESVAAGHLAPMSDDEMTHEAEFLLATLDGLQIQFLIDPGFDLESSFTTYVDKVLGRLRRAD